MDKEGYKKAIKKAREKPENQVNIECNLKKILADRGINIRRLSVEAGLWWQQIDNYESGGNITLTQIIKITRAINRLQPAYFVKVRPEEIWPNLAE